MNICLKCQALFPSDVHITDCQLRNDACFFGQGSSTLYDKFVSEVVTPNVGFIQLPILTDGKLDLPRAFDSIATSGVRSITMDDAPRVLQKYEELLRKQLDTSSELDRFVAIPESQLQICHCCTPDELMICSRFFSFDHPGNRVVLQEERDTCAGCRRF